MEDDSGFDLEGAVDSHLQEHGEEMILAHYNKQALRILGPEDFAKVTLSVSFNGTDGGSLTISGPEELKKKLADGLHGDG